MKDRPVIIGFGPAGMFAALELIEQGVAPLIFERGRRIEERHIDVQRFIREKVLDIESNIQFGEGGAGSYSDGKLFSRVNNSSYASKVLETYVRFGAPADIVRKKKPHLGTDVLCDIVINIRRYILEKGGEIFYGAKMTDLLVSDGIAHGVVINGDKEYQAEAIYLAVGNSARDTFGMIHGKGVAIEQKAVSVGVRIEHPAETINRIRRGAESSSAGPATYSFTYTDRKAGRGAYSFCMCPGGEVINASSEDGLLVLNGMSYSNRGSEFSNSAIVVPCHTTDYTSAHPLAGVEFQKVIEKKAFSAAGGNWKAPAQNLVDFLEGRVSGVLNRNSYKMGVAPAGMHEILPGFVCDTLMAAFNKWKAEYPEFVAEDSILLGAETRTSAPVRISRGGNRESANVRNLYPIGEGSGYTGGITSAAIDAIKAVEGRR